MQTENEINEPNSSPCQMADTDPAYHGFLPREEVLTLLNTLLSAERAGAKICGDTLQQPEAKPWAHFLEQVKQDEVESCRGLIFSILLLGGHAGTDVGDFYEKCMAIADLPARLQLLDKGQLWVVRKIREALPKISHPGVQTQLREMLRVHERNSGTFSPTDPAMAKQNSDPDS